MFDCLEHENTFMPKPDRLKRNTKPNARYNIDSLECEKSYMSKPVLTSEYGVLFKHQGFLMKRLHRMCLFVALDLPKQNDLFLD